MVNVDFSPALVLGIFTMAGGALLYNNRLRRPRVSRDYDVTIASISVLVGGILVFQGWRLDPLLLFGQLLMAGTAATFALEVFRLREVVNEQQGADDDAATPGQRWPPSQTDARWLPPPEQGRDYRQWSDDQSGYVDQQDAGRNEQPYEPYEDSYPQDSYSQDSYAGSPPADPVLGDSSGDRGGGAASNSNGSSRQRSGFQEGSRTPRQPEYDAVEDW